MLTVKVTELIGATAATDAMATGVTGDTERRFKLNHDGSIEWGPGDAVADLTLGRTAARTLGVGGSLAVTSQDATDVGFVIKGAVGQSGNAWEFRTSADVLVARLDSAGSLTIPNNQNYNVLNAAGVNVPAFTVSAANVASIAPSIGNVNFATFGGGLASVNGSSQLGVGIGNVGTSTAKLRMAGTNAALIVLQVAGASSQSGSLQEWQSSSSTPLLVVTAAGLLQWVASGNQQTTVGAAGGASAPPATPTKYLKVVDSAGTTLVIPAYAVA